MMALALGKKLEHGHGKVSAITTNKSLSQASRRSAT